MRKKGSRLNVSFFLMILFNKRYIGKVNNPSFVESVKMKKNNPRIKSKILFVFSKRKIKLKEIRRKSVPNNTNAAVIQYKTPKWIKLTEYKNKQQNLETVAEKK